MAFVAFAIFTTAPLSMAAEDDAAQAKLDKAIAAYKADAEKMKSTVAAWLDKREEAARVKGVKKEVDQVKAERKTFEDRGIFPPAFPAATAQQSAASMARMETAYRVAVKEFTQAKNDTAASAAEKQVESFRRSAIGVTAAEWVRLRIVGRWRRDGDNQVFVFHADGKLSEFNSANRPVTVGKWTIGNDGVGAVPLANGWSFLFIVQEDNALLAPAKNPKGTAEGPWVMKKIPN